MENMQKLINSGIISINYIPIEESSHFKGSFITDEEKRFTIVKRVYKKHISFEFYNLGYDYTDEEREMILEEFKQKLK